MYNIGLVVGNIEDPFPGQLCKGAMRAAQMVGDNLFIFPVKYFNREWVGELDPKQKFEYQYNYLIAYAKSKSLDMVIICLSSIGYSMSKEEQLRLLQGFEGIPVLLLATEAEDYSTIGFDNDTGLREGIRFLIEQKGCKHLGMLSGNQDNSDMIQRLQIFREVLVEKGLKLEEKQIVYGDLGDTEQLEVEKMLINNPQLDAIVCANDIMAKAVYKILDKYDFKIGKDICVLGFDDIVEASLMMPPLATVRADASLLGYSACMEGHNLLEEYKQTGILPIRHKLVETVFVNRESANGQKLKTEIISEELRFKHQQKMNYMIDMNHSLNILTRDMLMLGEGNKRKFSDFLNAFQIAGNESSYLFMLEKPLAVSPGTDYTIDCELYIQGYKENGRVCEPGWDGQRMKLDELFDAEHFKGKPRNYMIIDIYSREKQYGIMVCDMTYEHFPYVENICYQISMATKIIDLLQMQEQLLVEKEVMVQRLEQENLLLDNISNKDELTGIHNRRGFINKTMEFLGDAQNAGKKAVIIYVDLNYLKLINDRYSHSEGNFAIQACAKVLDSIKGENCVAGRIGGDEFALFCLVEECGTEEEVKARLCRELKEINNNSQKPYEIAISVGGYEFSVKESCELKELLKHADVKLYEDKANKKPFVGR